MTDRPIERTGSLRASVEYLDVRIDQAPGIQKRVPTSVQIDVVGEDGVARPITGLSERETERIVAFLSERPNATVEDLLLLLDPRPPRSFLEARSDPDTGETSYVRVPDPLADLRPGLRAFDRLSAAAREASASLDGLGRSLSSLPPIEEDDPPTRIPGPPRLDLEDAEPASPSPSPFAERFRSLEPDDADRDVEEDPDR